MATPTSYSITVHVTDNTPVGAKFLDCATGDFTSLWIGDASLILRGGNVERIAGVLNDYIAARAAIARDTVSA